MKERKITVLALYPGLAPKVVELENTLEAMQAFVGGLIECIPLEDSDADIVLVANDEGKLMGLAPNRWLWGGMDLLVGPAFIAAGDEEGNMVSLDDKQLQCYKKLFQEPILGIIEKSVEQ